MGQDIEWVIDAEELEAWEAEMERLREEMGEAYRQHYEVLGKLAKIKERGLARNPGEGLRFAVITGPEADELEELVSEGESVRKRMGELMKLATAHLARFPRQKPRGVED
jgi:hypothetical protein